MATIQLEGLRELKRDMRRLAPRIQKNILRGGTSAMAREVRNDAKANAPREFGTLEDNIVVRRRRGRRGVVRASVIVRTFGDRGDPQNAFYWRFQEFGYFLRDGVTFVPGSHFITNAYERLRSNADQVLARYMRPRIEKALRQP